MDKFQKKLLNRGEPLFGSIYGPEEIKIVNRVVKESFDPAVKVVKCFFQDSSSLILASTISSIVAIFPPRCLACSQVDEKPS
jgi:hypothetical protein